MADVRRTMSALQTLLADNSAGDISAQDVRDLLVSVDQENANPTSVYASPPSAPLAGDIWLPSDGAALLRYNGTDWYDQWGPVFRLYAPAEQTWAWINQDASVLTDVGGSLCISDASASGPFAVRLRKKAVPSTPYKIDTLFSGMNALNNGGDGNILFGVGWRESGTGELVLVTFNTYSRTAGNSEAYIWIAKFTDPDNFSASYRFATMPLANGPMFVRIEDDSTNRIVSVSTNGQVWTAIHSVGRTDFLTADEVGFALVCPSMAGQMTLHSWYEH